MSDDLRDQLRRADPAASLRPLAPEAVSRLLEDTISTQPAVRRRLPLLAAAAALVLVAVVSAVVIIGGGPDPARDSIAQSAATTTTHPPTATRQQTVTRLSSGSTDSGKCRAPDAGNLAASARVAFEGTVVSVNGKLVTLQVKHFWTGARTDLVEITQTDESTSDLLAGVVLKTGETYLLAAVDGRVMVCGYSGLASPQLRALYDAAF